MTPALDYLRHHWLAVGLLAVGLLVVALALWRGRRLSGAVLTGSALALLGLGGVALGMELGFWLAVGAGGVLFLMLVVLILSSFWWAPLGYLAGAVLLVGLGAWGLPSATTELNAGYAVLRTLEPTDLWWLLLLLLIPVIVFLSYRSLAGLGPVRRWVAIGLRCAIILLLCLALSEVHASHQGDRRVVIFVVDCSFSIPEDVQEASEKFVNAMADLRGNSEYEVGVIYFARQPRLLRSPTDTPRLNVKYKEAYGNLDRNYTDIASALKLALASFPEGSSKRIVLISDGNENLGNALDEANLLVRNNVQIDVVPIGENRRKENEVLIERLDTDDVEEGRPITVSVVLRSFNPGTVLGRLTVQRRAGPDAWVDVPGSPREDVRVHKGLNPAITFTQPRVKEWERNQSSYTFRAEFTPTGLLSPEGEVVRGPDGKPVSGLPGDLPQNNRALAHVTLPHDKARVLLVEPVEGELKVLEDALPSQTNPKTAADPKYFVQRITASRLPGEEELGRYLADYDCVVIANVPADAIPEGKQRVIRDNTKKLGCGLVMIGGPNGFGAGRWQNTPLEEALPVDTNIKSFRVQGKVGLVLLMHASEMPKGNYWQKEIAKLAIKELSPVDEVGILYFGFAGGTEWHLKLNPIGDDKEAVLNKVDSLSPGDMMDFGPGLRMAYNALSDPGKDFANKHVIVISDGDPQQTDQTVLADMKEKHITVTSVGVATHGPAMDQNLENLAKATGGRYYKTVDPSQLPAIYLKETRLISQDFVYQKKFTPQLVTQIGPAEGLKRPLPPLNGFVRTTVKPAGVIVAPIKSPSIGDHEFPILAYWRYGLGQSVAFTSDADVRLQGGQRVYRWSKDWIEDPAGTYGKFWEQVVDWSLRPVDRPAKQNQAQPINLTMTTVTEGGVTRVTVVARDDKGRPINNLRLRGDVLTPSPRDHDKRGTALEFEQKNSAVYEGQFRPEEAGTYIIYVRGSRTVPGPDGKEVTEEASRQAAVTVSYPPEFAELESNPGLMKQLREMTDGKEYTEARLRELYDKATAGKGHEARGAFESDARELVNQVFRAGPPASKARQPVWFWLLALAGVLLLFDVAVRRITVDPRKVAVTARDAWDRMRGRVVVTARTPEFFDRLRSRKARVEESIGQARAQQRFEGPEAPAAPPPGAADAPTAPRTPQAPPPRRPSTPAPSEAEQADYANRLLNAKKRIWQERDKGKGEEGGEEPRR